MPDMLVKLYDLDDDWHFMADQKNRGIIIRKPIGVDPSHRGGGTGRGLLLACLLDMKLKGYGYAVVGSVKDINFFKKTVGAVEIPDSTPGFYRNRVKGSKSDD
jgi:predicted N-acetyltransferase YhbS